MRTNGTILDNVQPMPGSSTSQGSSKECLPVLSKLRVITADITVGPFAEQMSAIVAHGAAHRSSYVCCVNAHMIVEAREPAFAGIIAKADFATPDGMPVLRAMQLFHRVRQERVAGNDILPALFQKAAAEGLGIFLFGASEEVQQRMVDRAARELPALRIVGRYSPPFAPLEAMDLAADAARIEATGAHMIMVSLGCPKQEKWMAAMKGRVNGVMLGVGGAFLLYAGIDERAPKWMRDLSLEWVFRLCLEPRRLWKRYLVTNGIFLVLFAIEGIQRLFGKR